MLKLHFACSRATGALRATAAAVILAANPLTASAQTLTGDELRAFVAGKTVHLDSPIGTLPVTYNSNGTLSGKTSNLALAAYLGSQTDRGRWEVKGNKICQKFFRWLHGETSCASFRMDGRKVSWRRDDGLTGTAMVAANEADQPPVAAGLGLKPEVAAAPPGQAREPAPPAPAKTIDTIQRPTMASAGLILTPRPEAKRPVQAAVAVPAAKPRQALEEPSPPSEVAAEPALEAAPKVIARSASTRAEIVPTAGFATAASSAPLTLVTREVATQREAYHWCADRGAAPPATTTAAPSSANVPVSGCFMAIPGLADMAKRVTIGE